MSAFKNTPYWLQTEQKLLSLLNTSEQGLTEDEAEKRLKIYGSNELAQKKKQTILLKFLAKFLNPLIIVLILASTVAAVLGDTLSFFIVFGIVVVSIIIDFYQSHQAEEAAEKLRQKVALKTLVIRNGVKKEIYISQVTVGDVLVLSVGDIVPADARLLSTKYLTINQSALTGESFPQDKQVLTLSDTTKSTSELTNCVFMGTNVISGEGTAVVVRIGNQTEFGKVAERLVEKRPETEFQKGTKEFGYFLTKTIFILVIFVFFINTFIKHDVLNSLLFALALAVGLTPELLPMVITVNLSKGALRMSKKGVIVKDLPAIQNFGSMDVLCTDKTGTLTEDRVELERYENIFGDEDPDVLLFGFLNSFHQGGIRNPLEEAVLKHKEVDIQDFEKVDEIPFDFIRKRLSVIVKQAEQQLLITKGSPEGIFEISTHYFSQNNKTPLTDELKEKIMKRFQELSSQGFRVLGVAFKEVEGRTFSEKDEEGLSFLGLMAFLDPAKESAKESLKLLKKQNIDLKILTGDNELVTKKICDDLGLPIVGIAHGDDIDYLTDDALFNLVNKTTIFVRLNPNQKDRIILALKKHGHVVGFLGDGINDAPSLRAADVGISVDNAVDVAKESADLILLQKDLRVLSEGVYEGRATYGNIMKYIMMETSSAFGNMFSVAGASLFLPFLPMLPVQILLNNLLYDVSELSIASDSVDPEYLEKPKKWDINFIKHFMIIFGPISSIFDYVTFFALLLIFKASVPLFQTGWFLESILTQILIIFVIRTKRVPFFKSKPSSLLVISSLGVAVISLIFPFLPFSNIFSFTKPPLTFYFTLIPILALYFILVELAKKKFYERYSL